MKSERTAPQHLRVLAAFMCAANLGIGSMALHAKEGMDQAVERGEFLASLDDESFAALKELSPFRRNLQLSNSLVLTGVATIDGVRYATLYDPESRESRVISPRGSQDGWKLVKLKGDQNDLETLTAEIEVGGGQVMSVRYEKVEFKPKPTQRNSSRDNRRYSESANPAEAAKNYKEGFTGDGYRGPPPPEIMQKLSQLSVQQRESIFRRMQELRSQGVSSEQRRSIYSNMLNQGLSQRRR